MLDLNQLEIKRIVVHHIPKSVNKTTAAAVCSDELVQLPLAGLDMFSRRIAGALGNRSKGIRVDIRNSEHESFFQYAAGIMAPSVPDSDFLGVSKWLAQRLCDSQGIKGLAESKLLVMSGVTGESNRKSRRLLG